MAGNSLANELRDTSRVSARALRGLAAEGEGHFVSCREVEGIERVFVYQSV